MTQCYDFILVGAGSAGCVLAERLSRNPNHSVLLLEAGGWDWNPLINLPLGSRKVFQYGWYQWGDISEPDPLAAGQRMPVPHGKVVGGTSSLNFMAVTRGNATDYERWVEAGAAGWSFAELLPHFKEIETYHGQPSLLRGTDGPVHIQKPTLTDPIGEAWIDAARELGLPVNGDYLGEEQEGFGTIQYNSWRGRRYSASAAFLRPALKRPNLTVLTRAHAESLQFEGNRITGVRYRRKGNSTIAAARAKVVLSLGAINTPQLLMLSGIGPGKHLSEMGIPVRADLPVGQGLQDHVAFPMIWKRSEPDPFHLSLRLDRIGINMLRAWAFRSGPAAKMPGGVMAFLKTDPKLAQPDIQLVIPMIALTADYWLPFRRPQTGSFAVKVNLLSQKSRGQVGLRSRDPQDRPKIEYRTFSAPEDFETMRKAFHLVERIGASNSLGRFRTGRLYPDRELSEPAAVDNFLRENSTQQFHPACTCQIGSVLEPDLSVKGLQGLHVVDASVMPHLVSGNPNLVIMAVASKAAGMLTSAK